MDLCSYLAINVFSVDLKVMSEIGVLVFDLNSLWTLAACWLCLNWDLKAYNSKLKMLKNLVQLLQN